MRKNHKDGGEAAARFDAGELGGALCKVHMQRDRDSQAKFQFIDEKALQGRVATNRSREEPICFRPFTRRSLILEALPLSNRSLLNQTDQRRSQRLTIVQYAGDFREAAERLAQNGPETYRGQRYTVSFVEGLAQRLESVTTITGITSEPYDVLLPSGARAIGLGCSERIDTARVIAAIDRTAPTLLIVRTPFRPALRWAIARRCRTLVLLADSINPRDWRGRLRWWLLARYLRNPVFDVVANHGQLSANQLVEAGVPASKVIPWDFPAFNTPASYAPKDCARSAGRLIYVGMLIPEKGVTDLLSAFADLVANRPGLTLDLVGRGNEDKLRTLIGNLGLEGRVNLLGLVPNEQIIPMMRDADIVIVPSRHDYPEGLPLTIYEAYCSRTPIVVSDHPMFASNVVHNESGLVFRARNIADLATQMSQLLDDPVLYTRLSQNGQAAWEKLQMRATWGELIERWIDNGHEAQRWLHGQSALSPVNPSCETG